MTGRKRSQSFELGRIMMERAAWVDEEIERLLPGEKPAKSLRQHLEESRRGRLDFELWKTVREYIELSKTRQRPSLRIYEPIRHVIEAGGKRVRPTLCLLACEAVGGDPKKALPTAAAVELIHTFTLIHDDVMDEDQLRRGLPTVHAIWGNPIAIVAGDGLFALAFRAITENAKVSGVKRDAVLQILNLATDTCLALCQGQTHDILLEEEDNPTIEAYDEMIRLKTGVLLEFALKAGAILGGGSDVQVETIGRFGAPLGMAFQIKDDLLDLTGDTRMLGKPRGSDIRRGKRTLMVVHAFNNATRPDIRRLKAILDAPEHKKTDVEVEEAIGILRDAGSLEYAGRKADDLVHEAKASLSSLPRSEASDALRALHEMADFVIHREK